MLGIPLVRTNIAMACHLKGKNGVKLNKGQAGCRDPTRRLATMLLYPNREGWPLAPLTPKA